jgi:hypothetical protein
VFVQLLKGEMILTHQPQTGLGIVLQIATQPMLDLVNGVASAILMSN